MNIKFPSFAKAMEGKQISNIKIKILLWLAILLFIGIFSYLSIKRYKTLNSYYYDLGIMNQVVYNTSRGRFLEMTNQDLKKNVSRLAIHFDPILAIFAPFYQFYEGPEVLLIGQAIIMGLGALAVFLIAQKELKRNLISLMFALSYLTYFAVQRAALFDFHSVTLATTFLLFALYYNLVKKNFWYYLFIILSLLTKEHVGLVILFLGAYLFFVKKEKKTGVITSLLGLIFFISTVYFIIPYFRGEAHFASGYFTDIKSRILKIINDGLPYARMILSPQIFAFFSPITLLISLPEWAINILSINSNQRSFYFHYNSIIVSLLFYSSIIGYKNFLNLIKDKGARTIVFLIFIILNVVSIYRYNPLPEQVRQPAKYKDINTIKKKSIEFWVKKLESENIKVATTPKLAPFFTNRKYYYNFLYDSAFATMGQLESDILKDDIDKYVLADYVIINRSEIGDIGKMGLSAKFYLKLLADRNFQMIYSDNRDGESIEVYKKVL
ncbi:MAG: hypothetical protein UR68_C0012G0004 [Candidatus Roizmanbacteria bacterium GW2011_GWA2_35_19]|uniref:Glycosyltransferase RgtA/B/C/D-like domain-containing protein n=2 Tax=Candidatus Roizmaniibacteriota TaxID=1752723 RepID=A0A0G0C9K0_9BACT|nr:MAG: hypothetical protein UR63_C0031G0004 [Candidatus Roizmanbacteria bacterium GW2011_GWC2_35_12]KKP72811.1 MAG: hypothetical protein UR68_C0012G0004 [Candidatus Roizmanbacteria bacterium GW2011_GWA2_35_19]